MRFNSTICPICHSSDNVTVLYEQNFDPKQLSVDVFSARRLPDRLHYRMVKCKNDGLVRSNPILSLKDLSVLYTKSKFTYTEELEPLTRSYMNALLPVLETLPKDASILEIGCGNGFILEAIKKLGFNNIFGAEPSQPAIDKAPKSVKKQIKKGIFSASLFPKTKFDLIFLFQTLDHIPSPDHFIYECESVLASKGKLLSFHHDIDSWSSNLLGEKSPIIDVEHTQLFSLATSKKLFERAGLEVISLHPPISIVSLRHLLWLFPLPKKIKERLVQHQSPIGNIILRLTLPIPLGNVCIVGRKHT